MLAFKFDVLLAFLQTLKRNSAPPERRPPRDLRRMREELRLARERQAAQALRNRLHGK